MREISPLEIKIAGVTLALWAIWFAAMVQL
jgi:hypothetical protein